MDSSLPIISANFSSSSFKEIRFYENHKGVPIYDKITKEQRTDLHGKTDIKTTPLKPHKYIICLQFLHCNRMNLPNLSARLDL
jgi:hypothetical protein